MFTRELIDPLKSMLLSPLRLVLKRISVGEEAFLNLSPQKQMANNDGNPETHQNFVKGNMAYPINIK